MQMFITVNMDNAAFEDGEGRPECIEILKRISRQLESGFSHGIVKDSNGNTVGNFDVFGPQE